MDAYLADFAQRLDTEARLELDRPRLADPPLTPAWIQAAATSTALCTRVGGAVREARIALADRIAPPPTQRS